VERDCCACDQEIKQIKQFVDDLKNEIANVQETIKHQAMSAREALELKKTISDRIDSLEKTKQMMEENHQRIQELQMSHNQSIRKIDDSCRTFNDHLRGLIAKLPRADCIHLLDYNSSKRADLNVLNQLVIQVKEIKNGLHKLCDSMMSSYFKKEREYIDLSSEISTMENELVQQNLQLQKKSSELERERVQLDKVKKAREEMMKRDLSDRTNLEEEMMAFRQRLANTDVMDNLVKTREEVMDNAQRLSDCMVKMTDNLASIGCMVVEYVESDKRKEQELEQDYQELRALYKEIKPPAIKSRYL
jgi:DNA repair exonuclease SbcCD ATPase subunit